MAEFFALLFSIVLMLIVLMPILTFLRLGRVSRELEELANRVEALERGRSQVPQVPQVPQVARVPQVPPVQQVPPVPEPQVPAGDRVPQPQPVSAAADAQATSGADVPWHERETVAASEPAAPLDAHGAAAATEDEEPDLEERIGGRGLLYIGVFVLLLGVSFFLKYAFDNAWINETSRAVIGFIAGVSLVVGGLRLATAGLSNFGHALVGTGFAVLYLVIYAALNYYLLIGRGTAFATMVLVTLAAAAVADRQRSQPLAFIAVGGGFLTPALVGGEENAQLTLFTYDAILVVGTMLLSFRHQWFGLNALSYVATFLTIVAWASRFYTDALWLRTLLFLTLFCVAFLIILRETRRSSHVAARAVTVLLSTAPLFYHIAALVLTTEHPPAIHIYLIAFTVAGLWLTVEPHRPMLRLVILLAAFIPMFGNITLPQGQSWLLANVVTIVAVTLLHIMTLVDRVTRQDESLTLSEIVLLHLAGIGVFSLLYGTLQPVYPAFRGALAVVIAAAALALGRALRPRDEAAWLNSVALAFTLLAIGIAVQFDGPAAIVGWAAEGVAVTWLGVRNRLRAFQFGGLALWILATLQLFDSMSETPAAFAFLFNTRALTTVFVLVCGYVMAWRLARLATYDAGRTRVVIHIIASVLTLAWITSEIQSFWAMRDDSPQAHLSEQMLLSLAWGLYGAVLIIIGMQRHYPVLRYIGITIIGVTALKVFFYDLWELGGIYRVVGFLVFGVLLVLVSYLYQRRRASFKGPEGRKPATPKAPEAPEAPEAPPGTRGT